MPTFTIRPGQVRATMAKEMRRRRRGFYRGLKRGAHRGKAELVSRTKAAGKVDQGQFRSSWQVLERPDGSIQLINDAPHAGIVERGARPHPVSVEGFMAIFRWALRKGIGRRSRATDATRAARGREIEYGGQVFTFVGKEIDAAEAALGICRKIAKHGQPGTFIVRDAQPMLRVLVKIEVERSINQAIQGRKK